MFTKLTDNQLGLKKDFIHNYMKSKNAADGSPFDANANVEQKNIATLESEINKDINIQINRALVVEKIEELFGKEIADTYLKQIDEHLIYPHDESSLKPYCASVTMYPFLLEGMTGFGGDSKAPEHIESYCGSFINLVFAIASQFAGAVATVEFLMYFDHFARKDYGDDYLNTHRERVHNHLQHVVYSLNQPAAARGFQSVFWNISVYDEHYFDSLFGTFMFPDGTKPEWSSVKKLQDFFLGWFGDERKKALLTYPVITAAMLVDEEGEPRDSEFAQVCAKHLSQGVGFFIYQSDNADSLSSCCRLRNQVDDLEFSYSLGAGGVSTGSINVITLNVNQLVQKGYDLQRQIELMHMYQIAHRKLVEEYNEAGLLPVYTKGFISLDKQYLTIGVNGLVEAAEYLGHDITVNEGYQTFIKNTLKVIYDANRSASKSTGYKFNTEFVPAENLGVKNAKWDKKQGLFSPRDCYNSYMYRAEDEMDFIDKIKLHGRDILQYLDGGSALHLNLEELPDEKQFLKLISLTGKHGCNYWCTNVKVTICNECGKIDTFTRDKCVKCGSTNLDYATRVIGYLKKISSFSSDRRKEEGLRLYGKSKGCMS